MTEIIYKDESYAIVGVCMEVHKILGKGFSEIVYKDALEYEFTVRKIPFERERGYEIHYKDTILKRKFNADFVVYDKIILEVKSAEAIADGHKRQTLNYMKITKYKLGIVANFGEDSFKYQRVVL
jgi:GxxExxY protein